MAVEPLKLSEQEEKPLEDTVVKIYRCSKVVKGGRRFSFAALVVVGDRAGTVGVGYGKANEVPRAVEKAVKDAKKSMNKIALLERTIPHRINGKYRATKIVLVPASPGTGVIAGSSARAPSTAARPSAGSHRSAGTYWRPRAATRTARWRR